MAIPVFQDGRAAILACQDGRLAIPTFLRRKRTLLVLCFPCVRHALPAARSLAKMALPSSKVKMAALPSWKVKMATLPSWEVRMAILSGKMAILHPRWPSRFAEDGSSAILELASAILTWASVAATFGSATLTHGGCHAGHVSVGALRSATFSTVFEITR